MIHAAIVGWGKCLPPATLTNADLSTCARQALANQPAAISDSDNEHDRDEEET